MNEALKKADKYQKRYMQKHRMLCVCLDKEKDEDIIEWMNEQASISDAVRRTLRFHINGREDEEDGSTERETPAGDQEAEGSMQDNQLTVPAEGLPEADPEDDKRAEDIRPAAQDPRIKTCANCQYSRIDYLRMEGHCSNEESEKGGSQITPKDTCGVWKGEPNGT